MSTVLIVDDSEVIRSTIKDSCTALGYKYIEAEDGQKALELFQKHGPLINLVLCDINMPKMNGISFIREIRTDQNGTNLPVIVVSSEVSDQAKSEGRALGVKGWLAKPFKKEILEALFKEFLPEEIE